MDPITILIMIGLFGLVVLPAALFGTRCSNCKKFRALVRTGAAKGGESFYDSKQEQWRCRFCQHEFWKLGDSSNRRTEENFPAQDKRP